MISSHYALNLNIAVCQVDPDSSQHYTLIQSFPGNPNHPANVVYLFLHGSHYQRIITADRRYSVINDTLTDSHSSNDECCDMDLSIAMDLSLQDDLAIGQIDVEESTLSITEESTSNLHCQLCNDDSNSLSFLDSRPQELFNFTQEVSYENVSDEASLAHATIPESTNDPIINDPDFAQRDHDEPEVVGVNAT